MNTSHMVHTGHEKQYSFCAESNIREDDGVIFYTLKIFDDDSDVIIFFDTLKEIKKLIKELQLL